MGNKTGKFNVPVTSEVKKDDAVLNENDVKVVEPENGIANGDEIKQEVAATESTEVQAAPKKKNPLSWLKKVSIRKEKKPKAVAKTNGVKEELVETPKQNGDTAEVPHVEDNAVEVVLTNGHHDHNEDDETATKEDPIDSVKEEIVPECEENKAEPIEEAAPIEHHLTNEAE